MGEEGLGARNGCGIRHWNGLWPPCVAINDGEEVCLALGNGKWSYNINVNALKTTVGQLAMFQWSRYMSMDLGFLARNARLGPCSDVLVDTKRAVTIFLVALIPGCARPWMLSNTARHQVGGTIQQLRCHKAGLCLFQE